MYKNKAKDGKNNISGTKIKFYRENMEGKISQRKFADILQLHGLDIDKNAIQRIESGKRFVTDIELKIIAKALNVDYKDLLE
ncbi:helix-turn-helix domain-containing protein [Anaerofustis sp. NSJ-163]|uniref:helix-turn-helix domain-containing protein n=1 Tax=Anaerofustis sp. NSJ-163 TaxID=2944391 RepID=UPI00209C68D8|nr:helix-turn-helix transcriptional regulator [Anaerofustis sp. NSJ-163]MCO8193942.1 helix-turn-helix domain-containing protein [Anaerofustis sp. NSJ-163]